MKDDAIQNMLRRHGLPPRMKALVDTMTEAGIDITEAPEEGRREVATVLLLVDGPKLIAAILASFLAMPQFQEAAAQPAEDEGDDPGFMPPAFLEDEGDAMPPAPEEGEEGSDADDHDEDANDQVLDARGDYQLIAKGGGHYAIVNVAEPDADPLTVRGKAKATEEFERLAGA